MKKHILLFLSLFLFSTTYTQITFNHRNHYGFNNAVLGGILPSDGGYYGTGIIIDSTGLKSSIGKFDENGESIWIKSYTTPNANLQTWKPTFLERNSQELLVAGYQISDEGFACALVNFNKNGDTLGIHTFKSPYFPQDDFIVPIDMISISDSGFIIINNVTNPTTPSSHTDISVLKVDKYFNQIWHKTYDTGRRNPAYGIELKNKEIIIGSWSSDFGLVSAYFKAQAHVFKLDSLGNEIDSWFSPIEEQYAPAKDIVLSDDGGIIVASAVAWEWIFPGGLGELMFSPVIFKLNENMEKVWETSVSNGTESPNHQLTRIVKATDDEGYVAAGDLLFPKPDTIDIRGWIVKVSNEGDSLWARSLRVLENHKNQHSIYDLRTCPDGGYVMCGQARNIQGGVPEPSQQAWLIKVDEHGCLVPGCHLLLDTNEREKEDFKVSVYPNPTTDYLNIWYANLKSGKSKNAFFRLINSEGKMMAEFSADGQNESVILPVFDYPTGVYFLQLISDNQILKTEKFIVSQ